MRPRQAYLAIISRIVPLGAAGAALLLGSAVARAAIEPPAQIRPAPDAAGSVAQRLAAVREAVSVIVGPEAAGGPADPNVQLVWLNRWNNWGWGGRPGWGWGRPAWNNWRNFQPRWNNVWRNW